jgi:hypothetical protein
MRREWARSHGSGAATTVQYSSDLFRHPCTATVEIGAYVRIIRIVLQTLHDALVVALQRCLVAVRVNRAMARQIAVQIGIARRNTRDGRCMRRWGRRRYIVLACGMAAPAHQQSGSEASPSPCEGEAGGTCRISGFHGGYFRA